MSSRQRLAVTPRRLINTKLVRPAGLEPARPKARDFKSRASTNFAMGARLGRHFPSSHAGATMASAARTGSSSRLLKSGSYFGFDFPIGNFAAPTPARHV